MHWMEAEDAYDPPGSTGPGIGIIPTISRISSAGHAEAARKLPRIVFAWIEVGRLEVVVKKPPMGAGSRARGAGVGPWRMSRLRWSPGDPFVLSVCRHRSGRSLP